MRVFLFRRRVAHHLAIGMLACLLVGCLDSIHAAGQALPSMKRPAAVNAPEVAQPLRIIIRFRSGAQHQDTLFLKDLSSVAQADVQYLASVAEDTHVYLVIPWVTASAAQVLARLTQHSLVMWAELDQIAKPS